MNHNILNSISVGLVGIGLIIQSSTIGHLSDRVDFLQERVSNLEKITPYSNVYYKRGPSNLPKLPNRLGSALGYDMPKAADRIRHKLAHPNGVMFGMEVPPPKKYPKHPLINRFSSSSPVYYQTDDNGKVIGTISAFWGNTGETKPIPEKGNLTANTLNGFMHDDLIDERPWMGSSEPKRCSNNLLDDCWRLSSDDMLSEFHGYMDKLNEDYRAKFPNSPHRFHFKKGKLQVPPDAEAPSGYRILRIEQLYRSTTWKEEEKTNVE